MNMNIFFTLLVSLLAMWGLHTWTGIKIPKWFFYGFYPAHLAAIGIVRVILKV